MDEQHFAAFDAVVRHGSVGKAAGALNSTQPTVSRRIRELEVRMGVQLFERGAAGMDLSPAGHELLPKIRLILDELRLAQEAMDDFRGLRRGRIRVGGVTSLARSFLPPIVADVLRRAPQLDVEIVVGSEEQLDQSLARREIDIVFATEPPNEVEAVELSSIQFQDRSVPFSAATHPLVEDGFTLQSALQQYWALGHVGATTRQQFERLLLAAGHQMPRIALQTDSVDVIISVVSQSEIVGWLPEPILQNAIRNADIIPLPIAELQLVRTFRPYRRSRGSLSAAARVFVDAMGAASRSF